MQIGLIGLGRMGGNIVRRLIARGKHDVVVYDKNVKAIQDLGSEGAIGSVPHGHGRQARTATNRLGDVTVWADNRGLHC